jgi:hypothetical protein
LCGNVATLRLIAKVFDIFAYNELFCGFNCGGVIWAIQFGFSEKGVAAAIKVSPGTQSQHR